MLSFLLYYFLAFFFLYFFIDILLFNLKVGGKEFRAELLMLLLLESFVPSVLDFLLHCIYAYLVRSFQHTP